MPAQVMGSSETLTVSRTCEEIGTLTIAINQVEYSNTPDGPIIHIFGRDSGGDCPPDRCYRFSAYFYVPESRSATHIPRR